jgi:flagellar biosynthesis/type III secretory pathway protein FliH
MKASWCWLEAAMALSDLHEKPAPWSPNALLNSTVQTPRFLRTQWDEASARSFGPWRVAEKLEPTDRLMTEDAPLAATHPEAADGATDTGEAPEQTLEPESPWTEAALDQLRDEAYQRGLLEGQDLVRNEFEAERSKERELMRHLGIELRSISQDPQRFFEPLKRLSLHVAEQLVRAELQLSGQAVHNLIQACIQQLDHPVEPVSVSVNPEDLQRLKAMGDSVTKHMQLEADAQLRPGSVRVRAQDTVVQDLIETRLEPLARRLLAQPEAWMQQSSLVKDQAEALPADTPSRDWNRQVIDVEDTEMKPASPDSDDTP